MRHKYEQVFHALEEEIVKGKYEKTRKLPTEDELMKQFEVSRNTIRKAIEILDKKGYIYLVQGSGMFVREFSREGAIVVNNMKGLSRDFPNNTINSKVLELKVINPCEDIADKLKCDINAKVYYVRRIRFLDGEPFCIEVTYFNKDIIPYLNEEIVKDSIYRYITKDLKLNIGFADKAICCDKLNYEDAKLLGLNEGEPALIVDNIVFLSNGLIFDVSKAIFNYKYTKLITSATYK